MRIAVIGSGIGGLAVAIRMANNGHNVTVFEKNSIPGGKASEIKIDGFRFDTGPTVFTFPQIVEDLFRDSKAGIEVYLKYSKPDINCKYFLPNGKVIRFYSDPKKLREELKKNSPEPFENIEKRINDSMSLFELSKKVLIGGKTGGMKFLSGDYNKLLFKSIKYLPLNTVHKINEKSFLDKDIARIFDNFGTFNGTDPYKPSSLLNLSSYTQFGTGRYVIRGGFYALVRALEALAKDKKVVFKYNSLVEKIAIENQSATGVVVKGTVIPFDAVISGSDYLYSSSKMFPNPDESKLLSKELSPSSLVFLWGIKRTSAKTECYNVILSGDTEKEFKLLSGRKIISSDPAISIYISSKLNKNDAPAGCENWQVMINAPVNNGQDWNTQINQSRVTIFKRIYETLGIDLKKEILFERIISPLTLERDYFSYKGSIYGNLSGKLFAPISENPNYISEIKNLYFVGGTVHPGGNVPMCLMSAGEVENIFTKEHPSVIAEPTLF